MATTTPKNKPAPPPALTLRATDDGPAQAKLLTADVQIVGTPRRVRIGGAARDAASAALVSVQPDEVVRVDYGDGLVLWTRADDLMRERGRKRVNRSDGSEAWEIDAAASPGRYRDDVELPADRGALSLSIKALEFFGINVTEGTASLVATKFERRQLGRDPGLYRVALTPDAGMTLLPASTQPAAGQPVLVFLHGTMSSVKSSFGDLWSTKPDDGGSSAAALRDAMVKRYGQEVYAFEHRTLSQSPIQNALELAQRLPAGAQLHLVSHSRGGLVGELLCLAERDKHNDPLQPGLLDQLFQADRTVAVQLGLGELDGDAAKARDAAYGDDRKRLTELIQLLDAKRISVRRFVRVACPARGTTLASGRLDRWLSVLNLLVPSGLFGDVADFLLAVVKERTDPRTIPGVEAMMPGSALTRLLHHPQLKTTADLSVIAGDIESKGTLGKLKLLAVDWFYGSDHDLVVNTGSMVGGIARPAGGARFRRDEGESVTHFNYFKNKRSTDWLADALAREDGSDAGFLPIEQARQEEPRWRSAVRASRSVSTPRPIAVVIPGTMGSALDVKGSRVWLAYWALMKGGLGDIGIDAADVRAVDLLDDFYGPLLEHLARTHRVEILPYDWRMSVREAAGHLADKLADLLPEAERTGQPVQIVAHSMGGLVARAMIADEGAGAQAWRRLTALPGGRLLMLGTPNFGSYEAVRWLTGYNPTQAKLILLDFTRGPNGVIDVVRRYPGVAELLPFDDAGNRWGQVATWRQLKKEVGEGFPLVEDDVLRQAVTTWKLLRTGAVDAAHMIYVAGCQRATVIGHEVTDRTFDSSPHRLRWLATPDGDGTVPWASGRLPDVPTYYAPDTSHDELCSNTDDRSIFRGYVDLLLTGKTDQLRTTPPGRARGAAEAPEVFVLPDLPLTDDLPDEAAMRGLGFGGGRARRPRAGVAPRSALIDVSVRHGDLSYARHPILVGHYEGDTIVSAEAALDQRMRGGDAQGPLSRRRDLGLYPGPNGTHAVFFDERPGARPEGALVVGLGQVGELSPGRLETGVRDALLEFALRSVQRASHSRALALPAPGDAAVAPSRVNARVSALLVGTGAGSLSLRDSMAAMLRGALAANRKLEDAQLDQQVLIDRIEFIELYEDVAIAAAKELSTLIDSADLGPRLSWAARSVAEGEGRRRRSRFDADAAWWQRLEITEDRKAEQLRFVATTDRARAEERLAVGQLRLADGFIAQACSSAVANANVSKTLFEMLLPNGLKESAPE
ncbi:MAG: hypothetical protein OEW22_04130, partial [Rubrivivax sp.]|nr:hypothetical protein [Rubrivivax sp.]